MDFEKFLKKLNEQEPTARRVPAPAGPAPVRTVQPRVVQPAAPTQAVAPPPPPAPKAQGFTDAQKKEVKVIVDKAIEDFMKGQVEKEL